MEPLDQGRVHGRIRLDGGAGLMGKDYQEGGGSGEVWG